MHLRKSKQAACCRLSLNLSPGQAEAGPKRAPRKPNSGIVLKNKQTSLNLQKVMTNTLDQRRNFPMVIQDGGEKHCSQDRLRDSIYERNRVSFMKDLGEAMPFAPHLNAQSLGMAKKTAQLSKRTLQLSSYQNESASELPVYQHRKLSMPATPSLQVRLVNGKV